MTTIAENIQTILRRIDTTCRAVNRPPESVRLLLATKTVPAERIRVALECGQMLIAENKVQEAKQKFEALQDIPHESHFIGHLQSNKIKDILKVLITCIQSVDRLSLAEKLQQRLAFENRNMDILIQVNTSGEESKFGLRPGDALPFAKTLSGFKNLRVKGLMTIGLFSAEAEKVRPCFRLLRELRDEIDRAALLGVSMEELSMGMSGDLEVAIEEGATIVRVGTAIFGKRMYPDSYYWNEKA